MGLKKISLKWMSLFLLSFVLLIAIIIVSRQAYLKSHPLSDPKHSFRYFEPTKLPDGFHITAKRIDIVGAPPKVRGVSAEMNLRTEDWVYAIRESKYNDDVVSTALRDYNPLSTPVTCTQETTTNRQSYRLCHWIDYGKISVYEVKFLKEGTLISATLPTEIKNTIALHAFVDSFAPAKLPTTVISGI